MIRIILADDHKLIRDGIKALLKIENALEVVGEAADGEQLIKLLSEITADLVLLDLNMPGKSGVDTIKHIKIHFPDVRVLVLSMLNYEQYVHEAMEAGATGYLLKDTGKDELISAIGLVAKGTSYICSNVTLDLLRKQHADVPVQVHVNVSNQKEVKDLTKRELEILNLIAEGLTNADIAERLYTSKRTIETHRQNLLEKTQTKNTATLIRYAFQKGLIS
ncbi:response regulator [Pontibacter locisalis]|uniref:Response regulator n=1 Tax=Pontibacter locisalis TaxID=1719035 RepID=A0ABW5IPA7_9BACT